MTYLVYSAWIASLLLLAGELDRLFSGWAVDRIFPELREITIWFMPPAASIVLPGAGQLMNGQPLKALLSFFWPILIYIIPRPWQHVALPTLTMLIPWYTFVIADALITGVIRDVQHRRQDRLHSGPRVIAGQNLSDYLSRRNKQSTQPPER